MCSDMCIAESPKPVAKPFESVADYRSATLYILIEVATRVGTALQVLKNTVPKGARITRATQGQMRFQLAVLKNNALLDSRNTDEPLFLTKLGKRLDPDNLVKRHLKPGSHCKPKKSLVAGADLNHRPLAAGSRIASNHALSTTS